MIGIILFFVCAWLIKLGNAYLGIVATSNIVLVLWMLSNLTPESTASKSAADEPSPARSSEPKGRV